MILQQSGGRILSSNSRSQYDAKGIAITTFMGHFRAKELQRHWAL
jgi:hypothetical protein